MNLYGSLEYDLYAHHLWDLEQSGYWLLSPVLTLWKRDAKATIGCTAIYVSLEIGSARMSWKQDNDKSHVRFTACSEKLFSTQLGQCGHVLLATCRNTLATLKKAIVLFSRSSVLRREDWLADRVEFYERKLGNIWEHSFVYIAAGWFTKGRKRKLGFGVG